ncbi:MAG: hypothetical protein IJ411_04720, partial [Oscillospiraceae bacterium]|nr:hypothetical protein [Oscillospiraceae bacterium]
MAELLIFVLILLSLSGGTVKYQRGLDLWDTVRSVSETDFRSHQGTVWSSLPPDSFVSLSLIL